MNRNTKRAISTLNKGGVIIFPTDTAFGIGCRIDNGVAVSRLFKIKKRPDKKPVPVLASSVEMAEKYVGEIDPDVRKIMKKYWPGGLTIVMQCKQERVPALVRGDRVTIGIRIPNHRTALEIIRKIGVPILAPSANFSGEQTPYKNSQLNKKFVNLVDMVLSGRCSARKASTVIDVTKKPWKVLREGAVHLVK